MAIDYLFLYQATECEIEFVIHTESIALEVEVLINLYRLEVQSEAAVVLTGYVLSVLCGETVHLHSLISLLPSCL